MWEQLQASQEGCRLPRVSDAEYTVFYGESAPTHLREAAGKSLFFCCVGTTVGSVSGRKIVVFCYVGTIAGFVRVRKMVVFQVRRNNCRVCKWCLSVRIYN